LASLCLGLALILPFLTGQIEYVGSMLLPMHLPVLLCGFLCGWPYGLLMGFVAPLLRSLVFGKPELVPMALSMAFELAAYGGVAGLGYAKLPRNPRNLYGVLLIAMVAGRVVWGLVSIPIYALLTQEMFTLTAFWAGGFINAWPGIAVQLVLIPAVVFTLERAKFLDPARTGAEKHVQ
jgi:uncharacterized membrane protein